MKRGIFMKTIFKLRLTALLLAALLLAAACGCAAPAEKQPVDNKYRDAAMWVYQEIDEDAEVDVFFLPPTTVVRGENDYNNMPLDDEELKAKYAIQIKNQKGIYDNVGAEMEGDPEDPSINTRFFAPYISQAVMELYTDPDASEEKRAPYVDIAYQDACEAFEYYMDHYNNGNPIILAGSSQGGELINRLVEDYFDTEEASKQLICSYAIGRKVTQEYIDGLEYIRFAESADDTQCIVAFNSEAENITASVIVGENEKSLCINPLNWSRSTEPVSAEHNLGCCVYSTTKGKKSETPNFCGAYIDDQRGTLKILELDDPTGDAYKPYIDGQPYGVFHVWDWEFFYRNLEANVVTRINAYLNR